MAKKVSKVKGYEVVSGALPVPPPINTYYVNGDRIRDLEDVKAIFRALNLELKWEGALIPDQFEELGKRNLLSKEPNVIPQIDN
jgi:hypothetical protein